MCIQEKETIQNLTMKYVRQHGKFSNREKHVFFSHFYLSNTHYVTRPFLIQSRDDSKLGSIRSLAQRVLHAMTGSCTISVQEAAYEIDALSLIICSDIITYASVTESQELCSENDKLAKDIISMYRNCSSDHYGISLGKYFYDVYCRKKFMNKNKKSKGEQQDDHTTRS